MVRTEFVVAYHTMMIDVSFHEFMYQFIQILLKCCESNIQAEIQCRTWMPLSFLKEKISDRGIDIRLRTNLLLFLQKVYVESDLLRYMSQDAS